ncbi:alpha/beta hydrolase [Thiohalocapsa marina]|uniref:Alpha/beta hydrolase n=2 Tax=Thiohalocapsa marina TaxID=424902 RepID=A0A5M8FIW8_9GAMM|nr:alpha/beta hydrolase [Thiohalocapsa marina]
MSSLDASSSSSATPIADGPAEASCLLLLAHGAGQGPASPFMQTVAGAVAASGVRVIRFAFPYMVRSEQESRRRPPDREPVLTEAFLAQIARHRGDAERLFIGGKSLGGRIASLLADEAGVAGLVCLGYPFHPPGRPQRLRVQHLADLRTPTLICQGERDPFGRLGEVEGYPLSPAIRLAWIPDGEHSFKPRKASGRTWEENLQLAAREVARFLEV